MAFFFFKFFNSQPPLKPQFEISIDHFSKKCPGLNGDGKINLLDQLTIRDWGFPKELFSNISPKPNFIIYKLIKIRVIVKLNENEKYCKLFYKFNLQYSDNQKTMKYEDDIIAILQCI